MPVKKTILLVTTKQPSSNPRLVKEATALAAEGYNVSVVYNFWSLWAEDADEIILKKNTAINWIKAGGHPVHSKIFYWYTRIRYKCYRVLAGLFSNNLFLQVQAATQFYSELKKITCGIKADLYIAHNLGALAAAAEAAKINNSKYAFDAEDFHRAQEEDDHKEANSINLIESHYFPKAGFITASSPLIAAEYKKLYPGIEFTVVNNVFNKQQQPAFSRLPEKPLKLFWFSQTVGIKRGIKDVINAMNRISAFAIEFTILGDAGKNVKEDLQSSFTNTKHRLSFLPPCNEEQLIAQAAQHQIGLALEPGFSVNNNIALSNKLFTYLLSGNAVILSATPAQQLFYQQYPQVGWCYSSGDIDALIKIIEEANTNGEALNEKRRRAWELASTQLNWENESEIFLTLVKKVA